MSTEPLAWILALSVAALSEMLALTPVARLSRRSVPRIGSEWRRTRTRFPMRSDCDWLSTGALMSKAGSRAPLREEGAVRRDEASALA